MAEIMTLAREALRQRGAADAAALAARAVSGEADGTALIAASEQIPTWRQRDYSAVAVGTPYQWNGQVYRLWQQHDATAQPDWSADLAVSLWDICHTTDPAAAGEYRAPQGSRGLYQSGECCRYGGRVWRSVIGSNAWAPDAYPSGWEDLGAAEEET